MKLSTKVRYGTRAMMDLAMHENGEPVQLKDIAKRQGVSLSYLEHVIAPLVSAGLVKSTRGSKGGIVLSRPPEEIKLREIVEVLEGPLTIVDCLRSPEYCTRAGSCATQDVWEKLKMAMDEVLENTTLRDLADEQKAKEGKTVVTYQI